MHRCLTLLKPQSELGYLGLEVTVLKTIYFYDNCKVLVDNHIKEKAENNTRICRQTLTTKQ